MINGRYLFHAIAISLFRIVINSQAMKQPFFSFIDLNHNRFRVPHLMLHVWKLRVCYDLGTHWKIVQDRWQRGRIPFHGFLMSYWNCRTALGIENFLVIILVKRVYRKLSNEWPMILYCKLQLWRFRPPFSEINFLRLFIIRTNSLTLPARVRKIS